MALLRMSRKSTMKKVFIFDGSFAIFAGTSPHWIFSTKSVTCSLLSKASSKPLGIDFLPNSRNLSERRIPFTILFYEHQHGSDSIGLNENGKNAYTGSRAD